MVNFNNVGKGAFIWQPSAIESGNPYKILSRLQMAGAQSVALKICDGFMVLGGLELLIQVLRQNNILVGCWGYSYLTRAPQQEAQVVASACKRYNPDYYLIDVEKEVENNYAGAEQFMNVLRPALAGLPLGLTTFWDPFEHPLFPWSAFLSNVDFVCPQVYWRGVDPVGKLRASQQHYASIPNAPRVPMSVVAGDMYTDNGVEPTPDQVAQFLATVDEDPTLQGAVMWIADDTQTTPELWQAFSQYRWKNGPDPSQPMGWAQVKTPLGLYVRSAPSGSKVGALSKAQLAPIWYVSDDQWGAITSAHDQWIYVGNPDYVSLVLNPSGTPATPPPSPGLFQAKVVPAAGLNVRDNPSGNKIGALPVNTIVQVYEEKNAWARINPTQSQWVSETYLSKIN
ncbi:MAG TPA: SH3 domain-containing protein [Anaerolineales bacterium]|nr:SH3 domain-containing protein [Anaerolineales bacterium]